MKTSDKLYELNAEISLRFIGLREQMTYRKLIVFNKKLGDIIKDIRELEDDKNNKERK